MAFKNTLSSIIFAALKILICHGIYAQSNRELIWESASDGGLSTHFIQMKIMHSVAVFSNRTLVLLPLKSKHYSVDVDVCLIYDLPSTIECRSTIAPELRKDCTQNPSVLDSTKPIICFNAPLRVLFGHIASRDTIVRSVNLPLRMKINKRYDNLLLDFKERLGLTRNSYTAVHWRRGDQVARCNVGMDQSVNCESVDDFIKTVQQQTNDTLVYIATDETAQNKLNRLNKAGFKIFRDANMSHHEVVVDSVVDAVILDVRVMLEANTFLGWGMSGVNDLVENERMLTGYSFCVTAIVETNSTDLNWCGMHTGHNMTIIKPGNINKQKKIEEKQRLKEHRDNRRLRGDVLNVVHNQDETEWMQVVDRPQIDVVKEANISSKTRIVLMDPTVDIHPWLEILSKKCSTSLRCFHDNRLVATLISSEMIQKPDHDLHRQLRSLMLKIMASTSSPVAPLPEEDSRSGLSSDHDTLIISFLAATNRGWPKEGYMASDRRVLNAIFTTANTLGVKVQLALYLPSFSSSPMSVLATPSSALNLYDYFMSTDSSRLCWIMQQSDVKTVNAFPRAVSFHDSLDTQLETADYSFKSNFSVQAVAVAHVTLLRNLCEQQNTSSTFRF